MASSGGGECGVKNAIMLPSVTSITAMGIANDHANFLIARCLFLLFIFFFDLERREGPPQIKCPLCHGLRPFAANVLGRGPHLIIHPSCINYRYSYQIFVNLYIHYLFTHEKGDNTVYPIASLYSSHKSPLFMPWSMKQRGESLPFSLSPGIPTSPGCYKSFIKAVTRSSWDRGVRMISITTYLCMGRRAIRPFSP